MTIRPISIYQLSDSYFRQYEKTEQDLTKALQAADPHELASASENCYRWNQEQLKRVLLGRP